MAKANLTFREISQAIEALELPDYDCVVGIARGGVIPASLIAYKLQCDLAILSINYRDDENQPRHPSPVVKSTLSIPDGARSILVVDDVSVSGSTMNKARALLDGFSVTTLVLKGKGDHVVFPDINTCVNWPWRVTPD